MKMDRILPFSKNLLEKAVKPGDPVVDATVGNGYDTLFLANLVGETGRVYGFDVQKEAVMTTEEQLRSHGLSSRVTLYHQGHEHLFTCIPQADHGKITAAVFNLGYLPGSDKAVVTQPGTTIAAVEQLLKMMAPEGIIIIVIYHGHPGGETERDKLLEFCRQLDQNLAHVLQYQFINQKNNPPFIVAIEKR
jgi:predicted methyltransferase